MSQTKAQLISGTTAQDLTVDNINTTSINSGQTGRKNIIINGACASRSTWYVIQCMVLLLQQMDAILR